MTHYFTWDEYPDGVLIGQPIGGKQPAARVIADRERYVRSRKKILKRQMERYYRNKQLQSLTHEN